MATEGAFELDGSEHPVLACARCWEITDRADGAPTPRVEVTADVDMKKCKNM